MSQPNSASPSLLPNFDCLQEDRQTIQTIRAHLATMINTSHRPRVATIMHHLTRAAVELERLQATANQ